jgi:hypothetical protein
MTCDGADFWQGSSEAHIKFQTRFRAYDTPWHSESYMGLAQKSRKETVQLKPKAYASINFSSCFVSSNPSPEVGFLVGFRP